MMSGHCQAMSTTSDLEPTAQDLDDIVKDLKKSWTAP
jgi:hypothetical protein